MDIEFRENGTRELHQETSVQIRLREHKDFPVPNVDANVKLPKTMKAKGPQSSHTVSSLHLFST